MQANFLDFPEKCAKNVVQNDGILAKCASDSAVTLNRKKSYHRDFSKADNPDCKFGFNLYSKISIGILDHNPIKSRIDIFEFGLDLKLDFGTLNFGLKYSNPDYQL